MGDTDVLTHRYYLVFNHLLVAGGNPNGNQHNDHTKRHAKHRKPNDGFGETVALVAENAVGQLPMEREL